MFVVYFLFLSFAYSSLAESLNYTKSCLEDPTQTSCADYHLDKAVIEEGLMHVCGPQGTMPEMVGCSIWRICGESYLLSHSFYSKNTATIPMNCQVSIACLFLCTKRFAARCQVRI